jgi:hypothetical protein
VLALRPMIYFDFTNKSTNSLVSAALGDVKAHHRAVLAEL